MTVSLAPRAASRRTADELDRVARDGIAELASGTDREADARAALAWVAATFAPGSIAARPDITGRLLHTLSDADDEGYAACCEALAAFDARDRLGSVDLPTLVMYGSHDQATPRDASEAIAAAVPGARLVGVEDAAHLAPAEKPVEVATELVTFFEGSSR